MPDNPYAGRHKYGMLVPVAGSSAKVTVEATEEDFGTTMANGELYVFTADVDARIKQGAAPLAATAGDGSMFVKAGMPVLIDGNQGAKLSVLRKDTDGVATLQLMAFVGS